MSGDFSEALGRALELGERAQAFLDRQMPPGTYALPNLDNVAVALGRRSLRLLGGTRSLIHVGLPEEAMIVARTLYTESLWLGYAAAAGLDGRTRLFLGWLSESVTYSDMLLRAGEKLGYPPGGREPAVANRRRALRDAAADMGIVGKWRTFPSEGAIADELGRGVDHYGFLLAHQMTHGSELAHIFRANPADPDKAEPDPVLTALVSVFSTRAALRAFLGAAAIVGWEGAAEAEALLVEVDNLHLDR